MWMAGGGIKGGTIYGATDDYGYYAVENKVQVHDLHATMLHLLGMDHKRLTFRFGGRDMRLTDVHGEIMHDIMPDRRNAPASDDAKTPATSSPLHEPLRTTEPHHDPTVRVGCSSQSLTTCAPPRNRR